MDAVTFILRAMPVTSALAGGLLLLLTHFRHRFSGRGYLAVVVAMGLILNACLLAPEWKPLDLLRVWLALVLSTGPLFLAIFATVFAFRKERGCPLDGSVPLGMLLVGLVLLSGLFAVGLEVLRHLLL